MAIHKIQRVDPLRDSPGQGVAGERRALQRLHDGELYEFLKGKDLKEEFAKLLESHPAIFWRHVASRLPTQVDAEVDGGVTITIKQYAANGNPDTE